MADEVPPRPPRLLPPPLSRPSTGIPTRSVPTPDHPCRDPRRWKHVRACVCPCGVRSQVLMQAGGSRHTLSCGVVAPPTSLGSCTSSHIWPTSLSDRALSYTDMSTLHRMTWWCVESTGLKHLRGHDVREGSRCRHIGIPAVEARHLSTTWAVACTAPTDVGIFPCKLLS